MSKRANYVPILHRYFQPVGDSGAEVVEYECVFGDKHDGKLLSQIVEDDLEWLEWIVGGNFPDEVIELIESVI